MPAHNNRLRRIADKSSSGLAATLEATDNDAEKRTARQLCTLAIDNDCPVHILRQFDPWIGCRCLGIPGSAFAKRQVQSDSVAEMRLFCVYVSFASVDCHGNLVRHQPAKGLSRNHKSGANAGKEEARRGHPAISGSLQETGRKDMVLVLVADWNVRRWHRIYDFGRMGIHQPEAPGR